MDFRYFYNKTLLDSGNLRAFVPYSATGVGQSGNFMANGSETGTTVGTYFTLANTANLGDFTAILTYSKENLPRFGNTGNDGAMKLMSNFASGTGGWTFGVDNSNFLFIYSEYPSPSAYTFDQITLGKKNCLALQRQGQNFSVYNYSPYSEQIEQNQTVTFDPNVRLSGANFKMGSDGYPNLKYLPGVAYFRGTMDQYAVIDEAVDENTLSTLLSGFSPYSVTTGTTTGDYLISSSFVFPTGSPPASVLSFMSGIAYGYFSSLSGFVPGMYEGQFSFKPNGLGGSFVNTYLGNESFCSTIYTQFGSGYNVSTGITTPVLSGSLYPGGVISFVTGGVGQSGTGNVTFSINNTNQYAFQFSFLPNWNVILNQVYQKNVVTTGYSLALDTGYYEDFYLYGVAETNSQTTLLATTSNRTGFVGSEGIFDAVTGYFRLPGATTGQLIWFNGLSLSGTGYSLSNSYVDIKNYIETSSDYVVYDSVGSDILYRHFNTRSYATGAFHLSRSMVFTGYNSIGPMARSVEGSYLETHPLHLYHSKNVIDATGLSLYNNNNQYWL